MSVSNFRQNANVVDALSRRCRRRCLNNNVKRFNSTKWFSRCPAWIDEERNGQSHYESLFLHHCDNKSSKKEIYFRREIKEKTAGKRRRSGNRQLTVDSFDRAMTRKWNRVGRDERARNGRRASWSEKAAYEETGSGWGGRRRNADVSYAIRLSNRLSWYTHTRLSIKKKDRFFKAISIQIYFSNLLDRNNLFEWWTFIYLPVVTYTRAHVYLDKESRDMK